MSFQGNREFAAATVTPFRDQTNEVIYSRATHNSVHRMQPEQGVHTQHRCHRQGASCPSNLQCVCEYDTDRRLTNKPRLSATSLCHLFFFVFGPKIEQQRCVSAVLTLLVRETAEDNQRRTNDVLQIPPLCDLWPTPYCGPGLLHVVVTLRPWCKWHRTKRIVHYQKNGVNIWNKYFLFRFKNKRVSSV